MSPLSSQQGLKKSSYSDFVLKIKMKNDKDMFILAYLFLNMIIFNSANYYEQKVSDGLAESFQHFSLDKSIEKQSWVHGVMERRKPSKRPPSPGWLS